MIIELDKWDEKSLIVWKHEDGKTEFAICSGYNDSLPEGQKWYWAHYYPDLDTAYKYWKEGQNDS